MGAEGAHAGQMDGQLRTPTASSGWVAIERFATGSQGPQSTAVGPPLQKY